MHLLGGIMLWYCTDCGSCVPASAGRWQCDCGGVLECRSDRIFNPEDLPARPASMWRYQESYPACPPSPVTLGEPMTPLVHFPLGEHDLWVKQEQLFPTGSFKDRGAALLMTLAKEMGVGDVVEDSSGNAGCAMAAYAGRAGIRCEVFVPDSTSPAKLVQMEACGAKVTRIPGPREATSQAVLQAARTRFYASHTFNPWFIEGVKSFGFELAEQLGWRSPDWLILPAGNGTLLLGAYKAFREMVRFGLVDRMPRLVGVQAQACSPLVAAFNGLEQVSGPSRAEVTRAEGIAIARPPRSREMLAAVSDTQGRFVAVTEADITQALQRAWSQGFFVEPTAAVGLAGATLLSRQGVLSGVIATAFTGHGLKAVGH